MIVSEAQARGLAREAAALDFVSDAFNHLKVIGYVPAAEPLLRRAAIIDELTDAGELRRSLSRSRGSRQGACDLSPGDFPHCPTQNAFVSFAPASPLSRAAPLRARLWSTSTATACRPPTAVDIDRASAFYGVLTEQRYTRTSPADVEA